MYSEELNELPDGWLERPEAEKLYFLAKEATGPVLEIGAWVGRSTCALAMGIRDNPNAQRFDVVDFGICGIEEWSSRYGGAPQGDAAAQITKHISRHGGTAAELIQNLVDRHLKQYVTTLAIGAPQDFATATRYAVIFADCMHDQYEIKANLPIIKSLMKPDCILACDDVIHDEMAQMIAKDLGTTNFSMMCKSHPYTKLSVFWT